MAYEDFRMPHSNVYNLCVCVLGISNIGKSDTSGWREAMKLIIVMNKGILQLLSCRNNGKLFP